MVVNKLGSNDNPLTIPIDESILSSTIQSNFHIDPSLVKAVWERLNSLSSLKYSVVSSLIKDLWHAKLFHSPLYNSLLGLFLRGLEKDIEGKHLQDVLSFFIEYEAKYNIPLPPSFYAKIDEYFLNYIINNPKDSNNMISIIELIRNWSNQSYYTQFPLAWNQIFSLLNSRDKLFDPKKDKETSTVSQVHIYRINPESSESRIRVKQPFDWPG